MLISRLIEQPLNREGEEYHREYELLVHTELRQENEVEVVVDIKKELLDSSLYISRCSFLDVAPFLYVVIFLFSMDLRPIELYIGHRVDHEKYEIEPKVQVTQYQ